MQPDANPPAPSEAPSPSERADGSGTRPARGAESDEISRRANAIARRTMSPFCPGRTLADCPSQYAGEWRRDIRAMLARGLSAAEIQNELERRAGENLSGSPNRDASYAVPIGFGVLAVGVLGAILIRLRRRRDRSSTESSDEDLPEGTAASKSESETPTIDDERLRDELSAESGAFDED